MAYEKVIQLKRMLRFMYQPRLTWYAFDRNLPVSFLFPKVLYQSPCVIR